jgi:hypothetical protein
MGAPAAGQHLLHHSVIPVLRFGLDRLERRVGEHGVVAPAGEQFVLPFGGLVAQVADAADDQPGGDLLAVAGVNAV